MRHWLSCLWLLAALLLPSAAALAQSGVPADAGGADSGPTTPAASGPAAATGDAAPNPAPPIPGAPYRHHHHALLRPTNAAAARVGGTGAGDAKPGDAGAGDAGASGLKDNIVAVVNGEVVTQSDVENRARLFALSTGLPLAPDVLERLRPQITRQLIDERLRMQEMQRRKIVVADQDVATALGEIEQRNGMAPGTLRARLVGQGVALQTLIDQIRTQLGWTRVLREELAEQGRITDQEITNEQRRLASETGQTQYRVSEIFLPVEEPSRAPEVRRFADTVIQQLHAGAPFPVVAAEFSQSQTALEGGDLGWLQPEQLDPEVAALVTQMPPGAISNPVRVAGGYMIVTLVGKRQLGNELATMISLRQAFFPFTDRLDPRNPTEQQKRTLLLAQQVSHSAHDCGAIETANKAAGNVHPSDPGTLNQDALNPQMRNVLSALAVGQASRPLVAPNGIIVLMVCSRETKNVSSNSKDDIGNQLFQQRVELISRQLQRDLRRRALIEQRAS